MSKIYDKLIPLLIPLLMLAVPSYDRLGFQGLKSDGDHSPLYSEEVCPFIQ